MIRFRKSKLLLGVLIGMFATTAALAADLDQIKARGELRHLGIRYANFVTGSGDGLDVEIMRGFAQRLGVGYKLVYSDFYTVIRDLLGKDVMRQAGHVALTGDFPIKGDVIATGFTVLPWRQEILTYSAPTFPSQVLLIAPSASSAQPIKEGATLSDEIKDTKQLIGSRSLLVMERTCLDPANYGLTGVGVDLKMYARSTNLNEMVPALLNGDAQLTLLDVPDAVLDLRKWAGQIKVLGPVSERQTLAAAFPRDAVKLRDAFNVYLRDIRADGTYDRLVDKYYPGIRRFFPDFFDKKV
ncbi:ABC transporter substrate-binding protein [Rhodoblastus sphagnicola]|uniref:ABC transporter substrate-binding protein n=1 Tax=Rhodoblastus sphagnicola TaxID=333368 RepID=A0A2S6N4V8_9HYPH|nr:transporter substrate-binding domain-containing protein [Rhodoblastus sphagnicola]MBB4199611.1 ABC-type amino acid transport substrate-binding protein [Rhodoblastus sphagnicola]PPQ29617.1 ABC transporter substrate-binding protein [Rhodoblastus sphagnicola]